MWGWIILGFLLLRNGGRQQSSSTSNGLLPPTPKPLTVRPGVFQIEPAIVSRTDVIQGAQKITQTDVASDFQAGLNY